MKTFSLLFVVCVCCAIGVSGQVSGNAISAQVQPFTMPDHAEHATQTSLASEQTLREHSGGTVAKGERPLWEVYQLSPETPLGDSARAVRKEHASARKATIFWSN
jgi:hypothetical protein